MKHGSDSAVMQSSVASGQLSIPRPSFCRPALFPVMDGQAMCCPEMCRFLEVLLDFHNSFSDSFFVSFSLDSLCRAPSEIGQTGSESQRDGLGLCALLLTVISVLLIIVFLPFSLFFCVKVSILPLAWCRLTPDYIVVMLSCLAPLLLLPRQMADILCVLWTRRSCKSMKEQ